MIKAILFDFDGPINVGTLNVINFLINTAKKLNITPPTIDFLQKLWGDGWPEPFLTKLTKKLGWKNTGTKLYYEACNQLSELGLNVPLENVDNLLKFLKSNFLLGILTNRNRDSFNTALNKFGINRSFFSALYSTDDVEKPKPHKKSLEPFIRLCLEKGIEQHEILYVGDIARYDYALTRKFDPSVHFVGVLSGANTREMFIEAGLNSKFLINSLHELEQTIEENFTSA